jgi:CheY-like chemotaxis protein
MKRAFHILAGARRRQLFRRYNSVTLSQVDKHRIVLIEDSDADIWLLRECLESVATNHELIVLKDGEAALEFVEAERKGVEPRPCVIILDLRLPKHDGLEILAAMRRTPALENVTALIVSTNPTPQAQQKIKEFGVAYAEKPNSMEGYRELATLIWNLCESKFGVVQAS